LKLAQGTKKDAHPSTLGNCRKVEASPNSYDKLLEMEIPPLDQEATLRDANDESWIFHKVWTHWFTERRIQLRVQPATSKEKAEAMGKEFLAKYERKYVNAYMGGNSYLDPRGTHILSIQFWVKPEKTDNDWPRNFLSQDSVQKIRRPLSAEDKYNNNKVRFTEIVAGPNNVVA